MTLREKLMHYTHDLDCGADLKQEAIATIEHIWMARKRKL